MKLNIPEGYKFLYDGSKLLKGNGYVNARILQLNGREAVEANVVLADKRKKNADVTVKKEEQKETEQKKQETESTAKCPGAGAQTAGPRHRDR